VEGVQAYLGLEEMALIHVFGFVVVAGVEVGQSEGATIATRKSSIFQTGPFAKVGRRALKMATH